MRRRRLFAWALAGLAPVGFAQTAVPTVTRLVKIFLDRENALLAAQRGADGAALDRLLSDDFEQRDAAKPGEPQPRAAWRAAALRGGRAGAAIEQMAVHDRGDTAIVSFLLRPQGGDARFVVDVWVREGDDWRLQVRYGAPAG